MAIKSIKVKNLLSFDNLFIDNFEDINCIVGRNNVGKSNLLKLIKFFYNKLDGERNLPPSLNSNYSSFGSITMIYDISRINHIVTAEKQGKSKYFKAIYNLFFNQEHEFIKEYRSKDEETGRINKTFSLELTLIINSNDSTNWSIKDIEILKAINYLYPFFEIQARHIDLYDWNNLWYLISRVKSFNVDKLKQEKIIDFFDEQISANNRSYRNNIEKIQEIVKPSKYSYREKVLNYIKVGLEGHTFNIKDEDLKTQSDGTNSHKYIEIFLDLLISLTRREYISPTVYIDEPEVGLHPKLNEELINHLSETYYTYIKIQERQELGRQKTPYPVIIFSTHSPNIVKQVIKLFAENQQILHFSKYQKENTIVQKMNSTYNDQRFLNIFSDNEARLFFSKFILFVEGETEVEIFGNKKLLERFSKLKQIDIYKSSSNVLGANINPSYANTSIPYFFLFDIDKIYEFEKINNLKRIHLKNKNKDLYCLPDIKAKDKCKENIVNEFEKYKLGYNKTYRDISRSLTELKKYQDLRASNNLFKYNYLTHKLEENKIDDLREHLSTYLSQKNIKFLKTTVEEALISHDSKELFYKWLKEEYGENLEDLLFRKEKVTRYRSFYKMRIPKYKKVILLNPRKRVKKEITILKPRKYVDKLLTDYIRVYYFNGKFEDLETSLIPKTSKIDEEYNKKYLSVKKLVNTFSSPIRLGKKSKKRLLTLGVSQTIIDEIEYMSNACKISSKQEVKIDEIFLGIDTKTLKDEILRVLSSKVKQLNIPTDVNKTNGWATSFLNFAIDEIEKNREKISFRDEFKKYFGELYDIIVRVEKHL